MTFPRPVVPGRVVMIQRRTTRRAFVLKPDRDRTMQRIFLYVLAHMSRRYGILVHAAVLMSDHEHLALTDPRGVLPHFLQDLHRELARAVKVHRGWDEEVFSKAQTSVVHLPSTRAIIKKIAYVLANPVEAGAVEHYDEWPGVIVNVEDIGRRSITISKPAIGYFEGPSWPETVTLSFTMPGALVDELGAERARESIADEIERRSEIKRQEMKRDGRKFLGARRCCDTAITQLATATERIVARNPTFADAGDRELFFELVKELREWRAAYREALDRWRSLVRAVAFPLHTWKMRIFHGAVTVHS